MLKPMLASVADAPLVDAHLVYEPKYDGIRAIVEAGAHGTVRLWSRLGNEKTDQFPEIAAALAQWTRRRTDPLVLDGEIVALDTHGNPAGFQHLQGRIHTPGQAWSAGARARVALVLFDLLRDGATDVRDRPLTKRRVALERLMRTVPRALRSIVRLSEQAVGDGRPLYNRALSSGWEGLIAKRADSKYRSGTRTPDWRKLKILTEQEFVIGGWTEPRQSRTHLGALLLGAYANRPASAPRGRDRTAPVEADRRDPPPVLLFAGSVGTGFDERERRKLAARLRPLETAASPFADKPTPNERPHWVQPRLVAQVRFTEWTADGRLRHPVYVGLRDDKRPTEVRREPTGPRPRPGPAPRAPVRPGSTQAANSAPSRTTASSRGGTRRPRLTEPRQPTIVGETAAELRRMQTSLLDQLAELEQSGRDGRLELGGGRGLSVTNLRKIFWPKPRLTKGDLFRYYIEVAPAVLPVIANRPLVMKRFPNGVEGAPFYQHRVSDVPPGVGVARVPGAGRGHAAALQIVGGDFLTLLYTTQLAAISQDPWFSRVTSVESADYVALDLDPAPEVPFRLVLDVARWIRDELERAGATGVVKTSGSEGLHVYVPLPPETPFDAGLIFSQIVATVVAQKHPAQATIERAVRKRGRRVYVDYLQNVLGKTLASAYSARASEYAGVSTPLTWEEVERGIDREALTIRTVPKRLREMGDLWATLRTSKGVDLTAATRRWTAEPA